MTDTTPLFTNDSIVFGLLMLAIAFIFYGMGKLAGTGTKDVLSCEGAIASVYLDIPADGIGEVKTSISGAVEHVQAQSIDGEALSAGTQVRIEKVINQTLVQVRKIK